ncbi:MAG: P-II family nitrogen regulator [Magnetococcales bacterium]|nr:P-II family nitrogen regulator [Magnetococcales bacterium]
MHFKLVVVTTRTDLTDQIVEAAKKVGSTGATILPARGTGIHEAKTFFGLSLEIQRDVILFILEEHLVESVLQTVKETGGFHEPGTGIAFALDIDNIVGLESQISHFSKEVKGQFS